MIIHDNIEFHNVAELVPWEHPSGLALYRYPREVRRHLSTLGHHAAACSDGVELRFSAPPAWATVTLSARCNYPFGEGAKVRIYRGDIPVEETLLRDGATKTFALMEPPLIASVTSAAWAGGRFSPQLWRIVTSGATVIYHDVDSVGIPVRPPATHEKPRARWLAYGSSITNATPGYVEHAARLLGVDVFNKGLSGACMCEPETAAYLAEAEEWDFATLELGVNMRGAFDAGEFESRARVLIETIRAAAADRPIVVVDILPNSDDFLSEPGHNTAKNRDFRTALEGICADFRDAKTHYIDGKNILTSFSGLSADLIHPSPDGHQLMGQNLARLIRELGIV